jgi:hypothetical protein
MKRMDFEITTAQLNALISQKNPKILNSSWIFKHSPESYRFIQKNIRTEWGTIDWDQVTYALDWKYQRLWRPKRSSRKLDPYRNRDEVNFILNKYRDKLYVFIAPADSIDLHLRDIISIRLVRLCQRGNMDAKQEILGFVRHGVDEWMDHSKFLARLRGNNEKIEETIEGCISRYRYTGSFFKYLYRTLQYAARGIQPFYEYSLDEPVNIYSKKRKIENVVKDFETGEIGLYGM